MRDFRALVRSRLTPLRLSAAREQKMVEEWAAHLEDIYDALRAQGHSDEDAWREIERQLPDARTLGGELTADGPTMVRLTAGTFRDLRDSLRLLIKAPGFSTTIVLTLAICLGANAAIFSVVHAVLLRPLPVPDSDRLVGLGDVYPTITPNDILSNDVPSYFDRLEALTTLEAQGMFTFWFDTLTLEGLPRELRGMRVTPSIFDVLHVAPALGRTFTTDEGEIGAEQTIILSDSLWRQLYGGDSGVIGRSLRLGWTGKPYTIVGVMPPDFSFFDQGYPGHAGELRGVQFWIPLAFTPQQKSESGRARYGFFHIGRLRGDTTIEQLQEQIDALHAATVERFPQFSYDELGMYTVATPLHEALTRQVRRPLYLLWAGAAMVLLIGVFNLANLALARASTRQRELATRLALGASRIHVVRQLLVEAIVPAALGGVAGIAVGAGILRALTLTGVADLPNASEVGIGATTVAYVAAITLAVGLVVGLMPATRAGAVAINRALGESSRSTTGGRATRVFRRGLVVAQVALSVMLVIAATLLLTSFRHLLGLDAGFAAQGVVSATIFPPPSRYPDTASAAALEDRVLERVRAIAGVHAAGITSNIALSGFESPSSVSTDDPSVPDQPTVIPSVVAVTPGYFEAMSTPLVRGRYFDAHDRTDGARVAIVDEQLAGRLWPGEDPLGKRIFRGDAGPYAIVGVVRQVRLERLTASIDAIGTAYFPSTQAPPMPRLRWIAVKSALDTASTVRAVRAAVAAVDPDLPISDVQTMSERTAHSLASERLAANLATMFAMVALCLSLLGIYAVLASLVARRTREIGIRMALGSSVRGVFLLVLSDGVLSIAVGLALGLGGAMAMARTLDGMLFGVDATDPQVLGAVTLATAGVGLLACVVPARRAMRINPVEVLTEQ